MKKILLRKVFIFLFSLVIVTCFLVITNKTTSNVYAIDTDINGRTLEEAKSYQEMIKNYIAAEKYSDLQESSEYSEFAKKYYERYNLKSTIRKKLVKQLRDAKTIPGLAKTAANAALDWIENGENADHIENIYNICESLIKIGANAFGPVGGIVADSVFAITDSLLAIGESSESEIKQLQNHLDDKFAEVDLHIDEVQRDISDLSKKVDKQTEEIIRALANALEANYAKQQLTNFMSSRDGNFDYTLFKEFLYASADSSSNDYSNNAFYNKLLLALYNDSSDQVLKDAYDNLYKHLNASDNRMEKAPIEKLYDYMLKNEKSGTESIQYYYFEYINANRNSLENIIPAFEALNFTLDLYETALFADYCIQLCNAYQLLHMQNYGGELRYYFGTGDNDYITYNDIIAIENIINIRQEKLFNQILDDITTFFAIGESFSLEESSSKFRICNKNEYGTFGNVHLGETIYLNKYMDDICQAFGIDESLFVYEFSKNGDILISNDGSLHVYPNLHQIGDTFTGAVYYQDKLLYSINFRIGDSNTFSSGSGTKTDPYIISTAEQFQLIYEIDDGLKKHYKLGNDIDLENIQMSPLGDKLNQFTGSFDGNGYKIYNPNIIHNECNGLFGYIGKDGRIINLTIIDGNIRIGENGKGINTKNKLYAGAFAGISEGTLDNCHVINTSIEIYRDATDTNVSLVTYAGGLIGECSGSIISSSFENSTVKVWSKRDYKTNSDSKNSQTAYVGGIVGSLSYGIVKRCYTDEKAKVDAYVYSTCNDNMSSRHPIIKVYAGGLIGNANSGSVVEKVYSLIKDNNLLCNLKADNTGFIGGQDENQCEKYRHQYVASFDENKNNQIKAASLSEVIGEDVATHTIKFKYDTPKNDIYESLYNDQIYNYGDSTFKTDNLIILVDGEEAIFGILGYYGFDTKQIAYDGTNGNYKYVKTNVTLLVYVLLDDYFDIVTIDIPIIIKENRPVKLVVSAVPNKTNYRYDELGTNFSLTGASFLLKYQDGSYKNVTNDVTLVINTFNEFKAQKVVVAYGDFEASYDITVSCDHNWVVEEIENHCEHLGYSLHTCTVCGETYKDNYYPERLSHSITIYQDGSNEANLITGYKGYKKATCTENGYSGDKYCTICHKIIEKGVVISKVAHIYDNVHCDNLSHQCVVCGHAEQHMFTTVESQTVVICKCVYCDYEIELNANSREAIANLPRIIVSNAYALSGGDEVVVYIELHSSIAITSAYFTVNFDDSLELVSYSYGNILNKPNVDSFVVYDDHINVFLAQSGTVASKDGSLLKLVFKTPHDSDIGDEYNIKISNKVDEHGKIDKFTDINNDEVDFLSVSGIISVVDHLPGDVNGDGEIDIIDAVIIAKYFTLDDNNNDRILFVQSMKEANPLFDISYGDVTLDNQIKPQDIVEILRYIVGGYDAQLIAEQFKIILNYNDGTAKEKIITVNYNKGNGTFAGLLEELELAGYRFDGWYTDWTFTTKVTENTTVFYNKNQYKQMLYANYTLNKVEFDGNGNTNNGSKEEITYSDYDYYNVDDDYVLLDQGTYEKSSLVRFNHVKEPAYNTNVTVIHTFLGWATSPDGSIDPTLKNIRKNAYGYIDSVDLKNSGYDGVGYLKLYAIWSVETITSKTAEFEGYTFTYWLDDNANQWDEKSSYTVTKSISLTAQWSIINYRIIYHGNGGQTLSGEMTYTDGVERNAQRNTTLYPNNFKKIGYQFVGWSTVEGGPKKFNDAQSNIWYINDEVNNEVHLYAIWVPYKYGIRYDINIPNNALKFKIGSKVYNVGDHYILNEDPQTINMGANYALTANTYSITGWQFVGWSRNVDGSGYIYSDKEIVRDLAICNDQNETITLYAVWEIDVYEISNNIENGKIASNTKGTVQYIVYNDFNKTPKLTSGYNAIVDWSKVTGTVNYNCYPNKDNNNNIDIAFCNEVYFIGNPKAIYNDVIIYTVNYNKGDKVTIHFKNMNIQSTGNGVINSWNKTQAGDPGIYLTLDVIGENSITSTGNGTSAIINRANLTITGPGKLTINAGNGVNATSAGGNGTDGGVAIKADNVIVNMTGTLIVNGGKGGNGKEGANSTVKGDDGWTRNWIWEGKAGDGGQGGTGDAGGSGGNGGDAMIGTLTVKSGTCVFNGGKGGDGSKGGKGGKGGTGGGNTAWGGGTGNGGKGGTGGKGGDAGHGGFNNSLVYTVSQGATFNLNKGANGAVGAGGDGGDGGDPGEAKPLCEGGGVKGPKGDSGKPGNVKS